MSVHELALHTVSDVGNDRPQHVSRQQEEATCYSRTTPEAVSQSKATVTSEPSSKPSKYLVYVWMYIEEAYKNKVDAYQRELRAALAIVFGVTSEQLKLNVAPLKESGKVDPQSQQAIVAKIQEKTVVKFHFGIVSPKRFEEDRRNFLVAVCNLLDCDEEQVEIKVTQFRSCLVEMTIPGDAALNLLCRMVEPTGLHSITSLLGPVRIQIDELPFFPAAAHAPLEPFEEKEESSLSEKVLLERSRDQEDVETTASEG